MPEVAKQQTQNKEEKSLRQTREQERASFAWKKVNQVPDKGKYKDIVRKFPSLVQNNGLGQALAFLLAKGSTKDGKQPDEGKEHGQLYFHLQEWICDDEKKKLLPGDGGGPFRLIERLTTRDSTRYRHVTMEAPAIAGWLKRFAEALAPEE